MKNQNRLWGLVFLLAAVVILLRNFGFFYDFNLTKLLFAALLVCCMVKSLHPLNFYGILIPAALIGILYDDLLHITMLTPFPLLAAAVSASIGLSFLFPTQSAYKQAVDFNGSSDSHTTRSNESSIHFQVSFAGATKYIDADDFKQAWFKCTFGSLKAYFDHAKINGDSAEIYVDNAFGDTSLFLPKEWNVHITVSTTFADVEEIHKPPVPFDGAPLVSIQGSIRFGDCKIYYI